MVSKLVVSELGILGNQSIVCFLFEDSLGKVLIPVINLELGLIWDGS